MISLSLRWMRMPSTSMPPPTKWQSLNFFFMARQNWSSLKVAMSLSSRHSRRMWMALPSLRMVPRTFCTFFSCISGRQLILYSSSSFSNDRQQFRLALMSNTFTLRPSDPDPAPPANKRGISAWQPRKVAWLGTFSRMMFEGRIICMIFSEELYSVLWMFFAWASGVARSSPLSSGSGSAKFMFITSIFAVFFDIMRSSKLSFLSPAPTSQIVFRCCFLSLLSQWCRSPKSVISSFFSCLSRMNRGMPEIAEMYLLLIYLLPKSGPSNSRDSSSACSSSIASSCLRPISSSISYSSFASDFTSSFDSIFERLSLPALRVMRSSSSSKRRMPLRAAFTASRSLHSLSSSLEMLQMETLRREGVARMPRVDWKGQTVMRLSRARDCLKQSSRRSSMPLNSGRKYSDWLLTSSRKREERWTMPIFSTLPPTCSSATILLMVARISTVSSVGQHEMRSLASCSGLNILGLVGSRLLARQKLTTFSLRLWQKRSRFMSSERWQASVRRRCVACERRLSRSRPPMCCMLQLLQSTRQTMLTRPKLMRQQTLPRQPPARQQQKCTRLSISFTDSLSASTSPGFASSSSCFWYGLMMFISSYSAQMRLKIFLLQPAIRRFRISSCRFSGEQRMIGCVVQKIFGERPSSEIRKGQAPEYSMAECDISTSCRSRISLAISRYLEKSKLWLMPQSSSTLYFSSMTNRQQLAPSSCSDRIFFIKIFIQKYYSTMSLYSFIFLIHE